MNGSQSSAWALAARPNAHPARTAPAKEIPAYFDAATLLPPRSSAVQQTIPPTASGHTPSIARARLTADVPPPLNRPDSRRAPVDVLLQGLATGREPLSWKRIGMAASW